MASVAQPLLRGSRDWHCPLPTRRWNARTRELSTSVLLPISSRFRLTIGWALTWSFYTAPPDFAKCNAFQQGFANMQWLNDLRVAFSVSEVSPYVSEQWFIKFLHQDIMQCVWDVHPCRFKHQKLPKLERYEKIDSKYSWCLSLFQVDSIYQTVTLAGIY